jgi:hypothetical protein
VRGYSVVGIDGWHNRHTNWMIAVAAIWPVGQVQKLVPSGVGSR